MPAAQAQDQIDLRSELLDIRRYTLTAVSTLERANGPTPVVGTLRAQMRRLQQIAEELSE